MRALAFAIAAALVLPGCRTWGASTVPLPEPATVEAAAGDWRHEPSGVVFPGEVGRFRRGKVTRYDEQGLNASVAYDVQTPRIFILATVYVYPAPPCAALGAPEENVEAMMATLAADAWRSSLGEVLGAHDGATLVSDEELEVVNADRTFRGRKATLEYIDVFGGARLKVQSYLYQFCWAGEDWIVKYRFTYPAGIRGTRPLDELLAGIRWP